MCDMSISPFGMLSSYLGGGDSNMWETLEGATITQPQPPNGDATNMYWPLRQVGMSCNNLDMKGHVRGGHMGDAENVSWSIGQKKRGARVATPSNAANEEEEEEVVSKKRRLSPEQVRLLEAWYEKEKRVEPEKKQRLAKELGLHPRQVAVWFQNRRARGKAKQLESSLHLLTYDYQALLSERDALKAQVASLKSQLLLKKEEEVVVATSSSYYWQEDGFASNINFPDNSLPIMLDSPSNTSISSPTTQESFDGGCKVTCSNMLGNASMLIHHQNRQQQQQQQQDHIVEVVASLKYGDFLEDTLFMASSSFLPHDQYDDDNHDEIPWLWP